MPIDAEQEFTGSLLTLLNPYALLGGLTTLLLFVTHGACSSPCKTDGELRERARALRCRSGSSTAVAAVAFLALDQRRSAATRLSTVVAVVAALPSSAALVAATAAARGLGVLGPRRSRSASRSRPCSLALYPNVMPSSTDPAFSLTTTNARRPPYTLTIMTVWP